MWCTVAIHRITIWIEAFKVEKKFTNIYHLYLDYIMVVYGNMSNIGGTTATARVPFQGYPKKEGYPKFPFDIKVEKKFMPSI